MRSENMNPNSQSRQSQTSPYPQSSTQLPMESPTYLNGKMPPPQVMRRYSRFDPMGRGEDDYDEDGYGDLGGKHPLRRVAEEDAHETVNLPGIQSLFGIAGQDRSPKPSMSKHSSSSLFQSPSLPSLHSPTGSPSTGRTSRYSSLASNSNPSDISLPSYAGWWAPESSSSRHTPPFSGGRTYSQPTTNYHYDEHPDKRRRSDGPPALRDAEESARLRYQAQSRNASYPTTKLSISGPSTSSYQGMRTLHPPPAMSAGMSRGSVSGQGYSPSHSPSMEMNRPLLSRNPSLIGGQLSQSFADLTASERRRDSWRMGEGEREDNLDMPPPLDRDRRSSFFPSLPPFIGRDQSPRPILPPPLTTRPLPNMPAPISRVHTEPPVRRQSLTRPPTPDSPQSRPMMRRSSLTESIMAKSGDRLDHRPGGPDHPTIGFRARLEDTNGGIRIMGWDGRRSSDESNLGVSLNSDGEGRSQGSRGHTRGRKRGGHSGKGDITPEGLMTPDEGDNRRSTSVDEREEGKAIGGSGGSQGPKYVCEFCAKTFTRPSSLRIHVYSHTGERPFICQEPTCRRSFSVQSNLKRHAKVHQIGGSAHHHPSQNRDNPHHSRNGGQGNNIHPPPAGVSGGGGGFVTFGQTGQGVRGWETGDEDGEEDEEMVDELEDDQ